MRILQVHCRYRQAGGEDAVVRDEHDLIVDSGHEADQLIVDNPNGRFRSAERLALSAWNPHAAHLVAKRVRSTCPDVVHVHNTWYSLTPSVLAALRREGVPVVCTLHNFRLVCLNGLLFREGRICEDCIGRIPWPGVVHGCYRGSRLQSGVAAGSLGVHRLLKTWQRSVDRFVALSDVARERLLSAGLSPDRVMVRDNFAHDPGARSSAPSESRRVLYVGRLSPEKGLAVLLEAWASLANSDLELIVVGDGPMRGLQASAPSGVRFAGQLPPTQVIQLMLGARALVFPSLWYEGGPRVPIEALAAGLPVIISDAVAIAPTLVDRGAGWTAASGDSSSLHRALSALTDAAAVDAKSSRARSLFIDRFSRNHAAQSLMEIYAAAVTRRS